MARGRKTIVFDVTKMAEIISTLESASQFTSRDALYKSVVKEYQDRKLPEYDKLTPILVYQRVKKANLQVKTPMGKRGNANLGKNRVAGQPHVISPANEEHFKILRSYVFKEGYGKPGQLNTPAHTRYLKLVTRIRQGSIRAAVNLKCLDCSNYQREEIKNCQCLDCPLFSIRPYQ